MHSILWINRFYLFKVENDGMGCLYGMLII